MEHSHQHKTRDRTCTYTISIILHICQQTNLEQLLKLTLWLKYTGHVYLHVVLFYYSICVFLVLMCLHSDILSLFYGFFLFQLINHDPYTTASSPLLTSQQQS